MVRVILVMSVAFAITGVVPARAANIVIGGAGTKSCGFYLQSVYGSAPGTSRVHTDFDGKKYYSESFAIASWIEGYVSALNMTNDELAPRRKQINIDNASIDVWLRNYCRLNPTEEIINGIISLTREKLQLSPERFDAGPAQ